MQVVSLTTNVRPAPLGLPAREAPKAGFRLGTTTGATSGDVIDVDVLWEDADDGAPTSARAYRPSAPVRPLRLTSPQQAIAAYRNAASTAALPHQTIDLHA